MDPAAGSAHESFQPDPGHVKNDGKVGAGLDAAPPTPLTTAATASTSSQVSTPHGGLTKVVSSTGGAFNALQPDPGHVKNDGRASVPRITVQMTPLVAADSYILL